jgi:hypothetical protein
LAPACFLRFFGEKMVLFLAARNATKNGILGEASRSVHNPSYFFERNGIYGKFLQNFHQIKVLTPKF